MRTTSGLYAPGLKHEPLTDYSQPRHIFIVIFWSGVDFTLFKKEEMADDPPEDVAQKEGREGEFGITE
jgi:hypothetical protein